MAELQREDITKRIKQARKEAGLTQPQLAALIDVGLRTYQNYEDFRVPWGLIPKIAEATGKSSAWILHGEDLPEATVSTDLMERFARLERVEEKLDQLIRRLEGDELPAPQGDLARELLGDPPSSEDPPESDSDRGSDAQTGSDG